MSSMCNTELFRRNVIILLCVCVGMMFLLFKGKKKEGTGRNGRETKAEELLSADGHI